MTRTSGKRAAQPPYSTKTLFILALLAGWLQPATAQAQVNSARELYAQAIGMTSADKETRAEALYAALRRAERSTGSSKEKRELTKEIKRALAELDPRSASVLEVKDKAASKALRSATAYAEAGWSRTAEELLDLALRLNPGLAKKEVDELRAKLPPPNELLLSAFKDFSIPYGGDRWTIDASGITSPAPQGRGQDTTAMLQSSRSFVGEYKLSIEVLGSTPTAIYGIAFGVKGEGESYHLVNIVNDGENSRLSFEEYQSGQFKNLAVQAITLSPEEWADWIPITITVKRGQIAAAIGDSSPLILATDVTFDGALGLFLAEDHGNSTATTFRHLKVANED